MEGIVIEQGMYGRRAVIISPWREEMTKALLAADVLELELNDGKGWRGTDLRFLNLLPQLKSFKLLDLRIQSIDEIHSLHQLLELELITYSENEIRFSAFPLLQVCALEWQPKADSLFECSSLKELFINKYDGKDLSAFSGLVNLESLAILNSPVETLNCLSVLNHIRSLRLGRLVCLNSLDGIQELTDLEELEIQRCRRIGSIRQLTALTKLRTLHINDCGPIESLQPLTNLQQLQSVLFYESTDVVDGDLTPLTKLPNLAHVSFKNRRHYSHRREDFSPTDVKR